MQPNVLKQDQIDVVNVNNQSNPRITSRSDQNNIRVSLSIIQQRMEITFTAEQNTQSKAALEEKMSSPVDRFNESNHANEAHITETFSDADELYFKMEELPPVAVATRTENGEPVETAKECNTLEMLNDHQYERDDQNSPKPNVNEQLGVPNVFEANDNDQGTSRTDNVYDWDTLSDMPLTKKIESFGRKAQSWDEWLNVDEVVIGHGDVPNYSDLGHSSMIDMGSIHLEVVHSNYSKSHNTETMDIQSNTYSIYAPRKSSKSKWHHAAENPTKKEKITQRKSGAAFDTNKHEYDFRSTYLENEPPLKRYLCNAPLKRYLDKPVHEKPYKSDDRQKETIRKFK